MKLIDVHDLRELIGRIGISRFNREVLAALEQDFRRWQEFSLSPRHVTYCPDGVIELMPCNDAAEYSFKYVNGHPKNTAEGKLSVVALGVLADMDDGYPKLLCEMTLLTAIRTAAVGALGAKYLARDNSTDLALIGTGAQSEFLALAMLEVRPIERIHYHDIDIGAMAKFERNMHGLGPELIPCSSIEQAIADADIITTATAARRRARLFGLSQLKAGAHIHAVGGDSEGKTELDPDILSNCKLVVEYLEQTRDEGEIQNASVDMVHGELWEIISGNKAARENDSEITLFDAVGFALEDYSILKLVCRLARELDMGKEVSILPALDDPKDLFSLLRSG
jgi:ornithine cyclodeaminase